MRGGAVFLSFFILFTLASIAVPVPLFPGNMFPAWFGLASGTYTTLLTAIVNGITYGIIVWLVFILATRRLDESSVAEVEKGKSRNHRNNRRRAVKR